MLTEIPTYTVEEVRSGGCKFYCPQCESWHFHGMPESGKREHRSAHCIPQTNHPRGYFIQKR